MIPPDAPAEALLPRFAAFLEQDPSTIPTGSLILIALSGGPDSMALLHLLSDVRASLDLRLVAAHFDHALRPESAREARRVEGWAAERDVACRIGRAREGLPARQEELRRARYAFLRDAADAEEADRVATGHHADDQAETVLFRMLRGTGLRGLAGIPPRRDRIVRPLLPFWRSELEEYVERREIPHLRDPANRDPRWDRVRIRERVLPALEEQWEGPVRERLVSVGSAARRADRALEAAARRALSRCRVRLAGGGGEEALRLRRDRLSGYEREMRARILRRAARDMGVRLTRGGTRTAVEFISDSRSGTHVDVGGGLRLGREFDLLRLERPRPPGSDSPLTIVRAVPACATARIGGVDYVVEWGVGLPEGRSRYRLRVPRSRLDLPLRLRGWRDGDRIRLRSGTRKVKRLFGDRRIPRSERGRLPALVSAGGRVLWVAGVARGADLEGNDGADPKEDVFEMRVEHG